MISHSVTYKNTINHMDHGRATTPENIKIKHDKKKYNIYFNFSFSYDQSNGINLINYQIENVTINKINYTFDSYFDNNYYEEDDCTDDYKKNIDIYNLSLKLVNDNYKYNDY